MEGLKLVKDTFFNRRINSHLKRAIKENAKRKGVTMSDYIDNVMIDALKKDGISIELSKKII